MSIRRCSDDEDALWKRAQTVVSELSMGILLH